MNFHHYLLLTSWLFLIGPLAGQVGNPGPITTGYARIHGLKRYYEVHAAQAHGSRIPLVLIHREAAVKRMPAGMGLECPMPGLRSCRE